MKRGRPRKYDPTVPEHIDQPRIPKGAYWNNRGRMWYTLVMVHGKQRWQRLAGAKATLAELHRVIEELQRPDDAGSIEALHNLFRQSAAWEPLSQATHKDYDACLRTLKRFKTRVGPASSLVVDKLTMPLTQRLIDAIATDRPAMANHVKRWLSRLITWGMQRGHCRNDRPNPAKGLQAAKEVGANKMPSLETFASALTFARERGQLKPHSPGAVPEYLWVVMLLAYRLRLRGAEVLDLSDANHTPDGIHAIRRKRSRENVTKWTPELKAAWAAAAMRRHRIWATRAMPRPDWPELCPLIVNASGRTLTRSALDSTWSRFIKLAMQENILFPETRFSLHGLKHRGITDTKGREAKQAGAGHKTQQMTDLYDHEMLVVEPTPGDLWTKQEKTIEE